MSIKARLSYPDAMRREIERKGMDWWAQGGSFDSFSKAVDRAKEIADERNFPVQVTYMGQKMTVYPKSIGY